MKNPFNPMLAFIGAIQGKGVTRIDSQKFRARGGTGVNGTPHTGVAVSKRAARKRANIRKHPNCQLRFTHRRG